MHDADLLTGRQGASSPASPSKPFRCLFLEVRHGSEPIPLCLLAASLADDLGDIFYLFLSVDPAGEGLIGRDDGLALDPASELADRDGIVLKLGRAELEGARVHGLIVLAEQLRAEDGRPLLVSPLWRHVSFGSRQQEARLQGLNVQLQRLIKIKADHRRP